MQRLGPIGRGIAIATLICFAAPQAEAIEMFGAGAAATQVDDGLLVQVRGGRGGGMRHGGGGHRGGGMHHGANKSRRHASWNKSRRPRPRRLHASGKRPRREPLRPSQREPQRQPEREPECEPERLPQREPQRLPSWLRRGALGQLGAAWPVLVADRRRGRGGRRARVCQRGGRGFVGGRGARPEPLLVLYRPEPPAGLLGRLPVRPGPRAPLRRPPFPES